MVFTKTKNSLLLTAIGLLTAVFGSVAAFAEGEAGIISLRGQGHFFVGGETDASGAVRDMFVGAGRARNLRFVRAPR